MKPVEKTNPVGPVQADFVLSGSRNSAGPAVFEEIPEDTVGGVAAFVGRMIAVAAAGDRGPAEDINLVDGHFAEGVYLVEKMFPCFVENYQNDNDSEETAGTGPVVAGADM